MLSAKLGHRLDGILAAIINNSFFSKTSPTFLTLLGLFFNLVAAGWIIGGYWKTACFFILIAGLFDMLDGAAARTMGQVSKFGGFIDSVVDRYSDMAILTALIIYYSINNDTIFVIICTITSIGAVLVPYTRARAEVFISNCNIGIMERAERIILLAAGCFFNIMKPVLVIMAILTHLTVFQRIYFTWKESK
jgi:CDP-diacylglycerol--glycerol-3-phosphate 3-phosphatidyltransferase